MKHEPAPWSRLAADFFEWASLDLSDTTINDLYEYVSQKQPAITLGTVGRMFWRRFFTLRGDRNGKHMQVIGKIGKGKSEFLRSLYVQHVEQGIGCAVIDPHGDLAVDCLWSLLDAGYFEKPGATDKVWYVDFSNPNYFLPWNVLSEPYTAKTTAQHIVEVCRRVWPYLSQAAPQFENVMLSAVTTLVENNEPITEMSSLLIDQRYLSQLLRTVTDRAILEFFDYRYSSWGQAAALMRESTLNKAFLLAFNDPLRYTFGQRRNALNFRRIIDEGISVIFNLSGLDDETQSLLGSMLAMGFENAAFSRSDIPKDMRLLYRVMIDEFQNCTSKNEKGFNKTLYGGRKFRVPWTYSHQSMSQVSEELREALENTMRVCFAMGQKDSEYYAPILGDFNPYNIKETLADPKAQERMHKERFSIQETYNQWVHTLKTLPLRVAYTRIENRSQQIKSLRHLPYRTPYSMVQKLIKDYTQHLMTHISVVKREVDGIAQTVTDTTQKLLPPPRFLLESRIKRQRTLTEF